MEFSSFLKFPIWIDIIIQNIVITEWNFPLSTSQQNLACFQPERSEVLIVFGESQFR